MATLILYLRDFDTKQFFYLDDYYDSDRQAYYRALQGVDQDTLDLTNWLEYFIEGMGIIIGAVKERVARLSSKRLRKAVKIKEDIVGSKATCGINIHFCEQVTPSP